MKEKKMKMTENEVIAFAHDKAVSSSNPYFKIKHFQGKSMLTPYHMLKQMFLEMRNKEDSFRHISWSKQKKAIELAREKAKLEATDSKYEQEYIRVDILNIEKDLKLFDQNEKAALKEKDRIVEVINEVLEGPEGKLPDGRPLTAAFGDEELERQFEQEYWTVRLAKQAATEMMAYGRIGTGNLDSIAMLPPPQQDEVLKLATDVTTKMTGKMIEYSEESYNQLRLGHFDPINEKRWKHLGVPESLTEEKLKLTIQGANKQEKEFQENNSIINSKYKDVKEATKPEPLVYKTEDKE